MVCITTSIEVQCPNSACNFIAYSPSQCAKTTIHDGDSYERMMDYAMNVLYVIGCNNLIEEVRLSMEASNTMEYYETWKEALADATIVLDCERLPKIDASYDMAWQQKGSGHQYNSASGHGSLFGSLTRRIIGLVVKSKKCTKCTAARKKDTLLPFGEHPGQCWKNHTGTSGSMEPAGCVELVAEMFDKYSVIIKRLCCNDDSSIRADCSWSNADFMKNNNTEEVPLVPKRVGKFKGQLQPRPDKGKLPGHVPEPLFVANPNHRHKRLTGVLIGLDKEKVHIRQTMTRMDPTRIGKNFAYMARTLKDRPCEAFVDAAKAVLEHHFDNHQYCGDWCKRKHETQAQRERVVKYYRNSQNDAKLYAILHEKILRFITANKLIEMAHGMDTNVNEAFNQICTWFSPKDKVFAGSGRLDNSLNSLGYNEFFTGLLMKLGITMTDNVAHYLHVKENTRVKRLAKIKDKASKVAQTQSKRDKLQEDSRTAKKEFLKRTLSYKPGMNMDDPFGEVPKDGNDE
jgi:hypothetical protein